MGLVAIAIAVHLSGGTSAATGARIFRRDCQGCHALAGTSSGRSSGGDLRGYRIPLRQLEQFSREMPARSPLTAAEIVAVSRYVAGLERRRCPTSSSTRRREPGT